MFGRRCSIACGLHTRATSEVFPLRYDVWQARLIPTRQQWHFMTGQVVSSERVRGAERLPAWEVRAASRRFASLVFSAILACEMVGCAAVDQFGSRAYTGNVNVQSGLNQEVLLNIVRASRYKSLSWNPVNSVTGSQSLALSTGSPTVTFGPNNPQSPYTLSNSLATGVNGSYTTSPLLSTNFQLGMITPVTIKTFASLGTYYPREAIFYALISEIDVKIVRTGKVLRLINDPGQDAIDPERPSVLDEQGCLNIVRDRDDSKHLLPSNTCSYSKFVALMQILLAEGLSAEVVEYAVSAQSNNAIAAQSSASGASLGQTTTVSDGRLCFNNGLRPAQLPQVAGLPVCGEATRSKNLGGSVVITQTEKHTKDDKIVTTDTQSLSSLKTTTKNELLPVRDFGTIMANYPAVGPIEISFVVRSPNGFLSYLGSWLKYGDAIHFIGAFENTTAGIAPNAYISLPAQRIFGEGPYLRVTNASATECYASIDYEGQSYCVPLTATHTAMLMDIAVVLRNLNVQPSDLNAPFTVRLSQ